MEQIKQKLLVIGMGWLGKQVASAFIENGWQVQALVRRLPEEFMDGVDYLVMEDFLQPRADKLEAELVFISLSPKGEYLHYPNLIAKVVNMINPFRHIIYCSSTGVYPMVNYEFREDDQVGSDEKSANLVLAEGNVLKYSGKVSVFRLGGLFGPGRIPGNFKKDTVLSGPNSLVNWIHSDLVIEAIKKVYINQKTHKEVFNLCVDRFPTKKEFYGKNANRIGKKLVFKNEDIALKRIVLSDKIKKLGIVFWETEFD